MAFAWLVVLGFVVIAGIIGTIIFGPIIIPLLAIVDILLPLWVSTIALRFFSLVPLTTAILPPGKQISRARFTIVLFLVVTLSAVMAWSVGALSVIGLSSQPPPGLILQMTYGKVWYYRLGIMWLDSQNVFIFVATGLVEIGLPIWAIINLVASIVRGITGWKKVPTHEQLPTRHEKKLSANNLMIVLSRIIPVLGIAVAVFFPIAMYALPRLYTEWHLGGWSLLAKMPGIITTTANMGYHPYNALFVMYPWHNWSVLFFMLPKSGQIGVIALLVIAILNLFAVWSLKSDHVVEGQEQPDQNRQSESNEVRNQMAKYGPHS